MAPADPLWLGTPQIWEDPRDETFIALAEAEQLKPTQGYRKEASEYWIQKVQEQLIEDPLESPPDPIGAARNRGYDDSLDSPSDPIASTRSRNSIAEEIEEDYDDDFHAEVTHLLRPREPP